MAETSKILEGVFAVSKPPSISSAQVIRDIQQHFTKSRTFAPLLAETQRRYEIEDRHQAKRRRRDPDSVFKIGHGGTLDPLATGVLIIGIGRGTKHLQNFLGCTKQYDTVVLFGKSTDTYDVMGKIVGEASYAQITKEKVEEKLGQFRGHIKQVPPVYSALKINGIKAYEYARSGKELPRQLESRDMEVTECQMVEFLEGQQHDFRWPIEEAPEEEKKAVQKLMRSAEAVTDMPERALSSNQSKMGEQRSIDSSASALECSVPNDSSEGQTATPSAAAVQSEQHTEHPQVERIDAKPSDTTVINTTQVPNPDPKDNNLAPDVKAALHTHDMPTLSAEPSPSPAVRVSLTVSSGFYVRSFAHDLGIALGSHGIMAELIRSRQGDFVIPALASQYPELTPTLTYEDFETGEDTWGPLITNTLEKWMLANPPAGADGIDDRDRRRDRNYGGRRYGGNGHGWKGKRESGGHWRGSNKRQRN